MGPEAVVTIALVGVIAGALAVYLILIAGILVKVSSNLNKILNEILIDIANKTGGVGSVLSALANDVSNIERSMAGVASQASPAGADEEEEDYEEEEYVEEEEVQVTVERPRLRRARVRR